MLQTIVLAVPMALLWMVFARQFSLEGFIVGYIFGGAVLLAIRLNTKIDDKDEPMKLSRVPGQVIALIMHIVLLGIDVFLSGADVARRVMRMNVDINPGEYLISTQDSSNTSLISALSAHAITITPGELVIDFEFDEQGQQMMRVHALDKEASSAEKLNADQKKRLKLIKRILGHE